MSIFTACDLDVNVAPYLISFDPAGSLDALVVGELEGHLLLTAFDHDYQCRELTDPTLDDAQVPAELVELDPADDADRAWWAASTEAHCPEGIPLPLYRLACECVGLGPVGFCEGFEPHAGDWPLDTDVIPVELFPA